MGGRQEATLFGQNRNSLILVSIVSGPTKGTALPSASMASACLYLSTLGAFAMSGVTGPTPINAAFGLAFLDIEVAFKIVVFCLFSDFSKSPQSNWDFAVLSPVWPPCIGGNKTNM